LARREHATNELRRKIRLKGFELAHIEPVLAALTQEGLLNNQRYLENYIHFRQQKGFGPIRIRAELAQHDLPEELIEHHLQIADNAWFVVAQQVWQKRFKKQIARDYKTQSQQMRFLQYRGFTMEQIEYVIKPK
jgi:regulatory protein